MSPDGPGRRLDRLAQRVGAGEVVFFIGAGFSLDSEGNSANVLIARLLMRFEALCSTLEAQGQPEQRAAALRLRRELRRTFALGSPAPGSETPVALFDDTERLRTRLKSLAKDYFQINDWVCSAFDALLGLLAQHTPRGFAAKVRRAEAASQQRLRDLLGWDERGVYLGALDLALPIAFRRHCERLALDGNERALAGKVLFLDTMGFDDATVMAGEPMHPDVQRVAAAVDGRLLPRHHALAWLAAEGLAPVVVTTNFDLLLESAWRLAGLEPWNPPDPAPAAGDDDVQRPRNQRYGHFARIAEAWQFFRHGHAQRAAHLHKIHGCAEAYRRVRARAASQGAKGGHAALRAMLPTLVFTYREIQNWREDTWSRDHLNTLLRTRTIVFSGYSVADPVIHDTFRTIYEEMADVRLAAAGGTDGKMLAEALPEAATAGLDRPHEAAPAFVLTPEPEFYATEILRAASLAAGDRRALRGDHPNLLAFHLRHAGQVPTLDDTYRVLYHFCARGLQAQALEAQLMHTGYRIAGGRLPAAEAEALRANFQALRAREQALADAVLQLDPPPRSPGAGTPAERGHRLRALAGWTWQFQRLLLREYALAEALVRDPAEALGAGRVAELPWYCPASEHPDWAAWCVVIELAVRRVAWVRSGAAGSWLDDVDRATLRAADGAAPVIELPEGGVRRALVIELSSLRRLAMRRLPPALRALPPLRWELRHETVPWWHDSDTHRPPGTPPAAALWQWAALPPERWSFDPTPFFEPALEEATP